MFRWSWRKPFNINPNCLALAPKNWSNKLNATATGTFSLLAWSMAWIKAQLSLSRWSLNIQYTTGPFCLLDPSLRTRIRPGWTEAGWLGDEDREAMEKQRVKRAGNWRCLLTCAGSVAVWRIMWARVPRLRKRKERSGGKEKGEKNGGNCRQLKLWFWNDGRVSMSFWHVALFDAVK